MIVHKDYQVTDSVESITFIKVKGASYTNLSTIDPSYIAVKDTTPYDRVWDEADYVIPPQMKNSFFVMTNMLITEGQTQGKFAEFSPELGSYTAGFRIQFSFNMFYRRNLYETDDSTYLKICQYNEEDEQQSLCPIFRLRDIVKLAGENFENIAYTGGSIIDWICNLDESYDKCKPTYRFRRIDRKDVKVSSGYNFSFVNGLSHLFHRFSHQYRNNGITYRTLTKAYGILFEIVVEGEVGKFSVTKCVLAIGASWGALGIVSCFP
ncbi:P2X purinoceptor 4-like [Saccoglossus kowalevskii]